LFWATTILPFSAKAQKPGFASKTSYLAISKEVNTSQVLLPHCSLGLVWLLARHGTRNPSLDDMQEMATSLPKLRDNILSAWEAGRTGLDIEQVEALRGWRWEKAGQEFNILTSSGHLEHWLLGKRFGDRLTDMGFRINLEDNRTSVSSSSKQRARASAESFLDGFQGIPSNSNGHNITEEGVLRYPDIITDDHLLRYYDYCPKYQDEVKGSYKVEVEKFETSKAFSKMIERVNGRVGLQLDNEEARLMWNICRFETAWNLGEDSPWCAVFVAEDLAVFEFREDLKYFYKYDQSNVTVEMTQPLWETIFADLDDLNTGASHPFVRLNFAHLSTIMPMLRAFGLYKDLGLKASDWPARERLWKTSKIGVFASNLAVFMFQCNQTSADDSYQRKRQMNSNEERREPEGDSSEEDSSEESREDSSEEVSSAEASSNEDEREEEEKDVANGPKEGWQVMVLHQERPLALDVCGGVALCPLHTFLQAFGDLAMTDFNATCLP